MRFPTASVILPQGVLAGCDDLYVIWVAADPVPAQVIALHLGRDLHVLVMLKRYSVGDTFPMTGSSLPLAVAVGRGCSLPLPASRLIIHLDEALQSR
jgi:hypothetical protein